MRHSVAQTAQLLLHHTRCSPALSCRADANRDEARPAPARRPGPPLTSLPMPAALPIARRHVAQSMQQVAERAIRVVTDAAWQAEKAAELAEADRRGARRGALLATCFGTLAVLAGIAVLAAVRLNMRTNAEMASIAAALSQLQMTQRQINDRLTALQASSTTQAAPGSRGSIRPVAPATTSPVTLPLAPIGHALPVGNKPLPPFAQSVPNGSVWPQPHHAARDEPRRLDRIAPQSVAVARGAAATTE